MMDVETRNEIEGVKTVAYDALNKINTHEVLCAERYGHLLKTLDRLDETVKTVVKSTDSMIWKFVVGVTLVGGFLITLAIFLMKLGGKG